MTQPRSMLPASFRLNAPHIDDDDAEGDQADRPSHETLGPNFRLNAPHVDDEESQAPSSTEPASDNYTDDIARAVPISSPRAGEQFSRQTAADTSEHELDNNNDKVDETEVAPDNTPPVTPDETEVAPDNAPPVTPEEQQSRVTAPSSPEMVESDSSNKHSKVPPWCTRKVAVASGVVIAALIVVIVVLSVYLPEDSSSPPATKISTLAKISSRGTLRCGVGVKLGFSSLNSATGQREGFEIDLCRAIGAAIFGQDGHTEYSLVTSDNQFSILQSGEVDLLAAGTTYTIQSDVFEPLANAGFTFSAPYFYNGLTFAGLPQYVACAEAGQTTGNCSGLKICVQDIASYTDILNGLLPNFPQIKPTPTQQQLYYNFKGGTCNVIAGEGIDLIEIAVTEIGYTGPYNISLQQYSKEPLSLVTRDDDVEWSDYVNWVLLGLLTAENQNITQATAKIANPTDTVVASQMLFYDAVATVGNYGEVYERNLGLLLPRAYANMLNNGSFPLISSIPLGDVNVSGPGPTVGGTLEKIAQSGTLRCGVAVNAFFSYLNNSTQQWSGMDIDFCRAVAAALFGHSSVPQFVPVTAANRFQELANGNIDIITRTTSETYLRNVDEPSTGGAGFSFSQPYFYTGVQFGGIPLYVTCADEVITSGYCGKLLICVTNGTTTYDVVRLRFPSHFIVETDSKEHLAQCLVTSQSNVIAGNGFDTANATIGAVYHGSYEEGTKLFSRDNLAIVANQADAQWSSFVSLVVTATMYARERGYSQATFRRMPLVNLFGPTYTNMLRDVIQAVGSYSELYVRSANSKYPRPAINSMSTAPYGPQHYPSPGLFLLV